MASKFAQKGVLALVCLTVSVGEAMAASKGAAGFTKATQEVSSYQTPVSNLMKAIARSSCLSARSTSISRCRTVTRT